MTKVKDGYCRQLKYAALVFKGKLKENVSMYLCAYFCSPLPHSLVVCTVAPTLTSPNDPLGQVAATQCHCALYST